MRSISTQKRKIAIILLLVWFINLLVPSVAYALTSGPTQPETKGFQPAGVSDMVDVQSGGFKYNIPLLDIDGYPINLNYQSGVGMDDEASWVGLGWSLNPGAINRQVRGVPDDMEGDLAETDHYTKPKVTVGARLRGKIELGGNLQGGSSDDKTPTPTPKVKGEGTFSLGIFSDNYTGIGAEIGVNAGISISQGNDGPMTAGLGLGVLSSTATGVDFTPSVNLGIKAHADQNTTVNAGLSANLGYNTRSGLKDLTLGGSFSVTAQKTDIESVKQADGTFKDLPVRKEGSASFGGGGSIISYNTEPIQPRLQIPYSTSYGSFSFDFGISEAILFGGGGGTGYKSVKKVTSFANHNPVYGFLYAEAGKHQTHAIMDFIREKENPIIPTLPNLALPVHTPDLFTYTSQTGSGQFRLYRGGSGAFFDNEVTDQSDVSSLGIDVGIGTYFHGGVTLFNQNTSNTTRKWSGDNLYLKYGDFQDLSYTDPKSEHAYFKIVGEKSAEDVDMATQLHDVQPLAVNISGTTALASFSGMADYKGAVKNTALSAPLKRITRQVKKTVVSYLTAAEASIGGLDKSINYYDFNTFTNNTNFIPPAENKPIGSITRNSGDRKNHHISEISVTDDQGKRMVYGVPVYNHTQVEYSFAIGSNYTKPKAGNIVDLSDNNGLFPTESMLGQGNSSIDNYYHKEIQPAYASSFLLSAILSPDYVDKSGDGISDDDAGTAIQFKYSKKADFFKWRTPYNNATLNRGQFADKDDDKASIVYGEKELWYVSSIESKTKIAYFITEDRDDALGVTSYAGVKDPSNRQKRLREIRLYSKADRSKPIKVVKFEYSYELCPNTPNSVASGNGTGKLTLTKVYFEYGNTVKGAAHPYNFYYSQNLKNDPATLKPSTADFSKYNTGYATMSTDRWGVFKANDPLFPNDEFPYTKQDFDGKNANKNQLDNDASMWHLRLIELPTGGIIGVNYESNDYAYVQDKKAMAMNIVGDFIDNRGTVFTPAKDDGTSLSLMKGFAIPVPGMADNPDARVWFERTYLNGSEYIYSKFSVKLTTDNSYHDPDHDYDYVSCFSKISNVSIVNNIAHVMLEYRSQDGVYNIGAALSNNPIIFSAWQKMKEEYPRYAYAGFDRRAQDEGSFEGAVRALCSSFGNLEELGLNFYQKADNNNYAASIDPAKCFIRLTKQDGKKLGGGVRVNKIIISDAWSGDSHTYGQAYDYTTTENGVQISSGVASYEPSIGNDENPLKQPVSYVQNIKGGISNYYDLELPFGESFYPAPSVGYSKVKVTDLDQNGNPDPNLKTGYIVNEFYTSKDFPVRVSVTDMQEKSNIGLDNHYSITDTWSENNLCMSQGYAIELNDMAGKSKAVRIYNQAKSEISSTVYYYNASKIGGGKMKLDNLVDIVNPDGTVSHNNVMARDIEFYTDFREQETINDGQTVNIGVDIVPIFGVPIPIPHWPGGDNTELKLFRSACAVKVSQYYGILNKVVKTQNGSTSTTENIAYDGLTGDPVVTKTQNEFNNDIYSVNIPAYWAYNGMGPAYKNLGVILSNFSTDANGAINTNYSDFFTSGDQFVDLSTGNQYYVIDEMINTANNKPEYAPEAPGVGGYMPSTGAANYTHVKYVMSKNGVIQKLGLALIKITRSGYRNMLGADITSIVCLNNPIITDAGGTHLQLAQTGSGG